MTLEQECFSGDQDYTGKQPILSRILLKLREEVLPGTPYGEEYSQNLYRRNVRVHLLKNGIRWEDGFTLVQVNFLG